VILARTTTSGPPVIPCDKCPIAGLKDFRRFTPDELRFMKDFKTGHLTLDPGSTVLLEGTHSAHLFTVVSGWMFRHKALSDGRRQLLNYALPGDLIGLQGSLLGEMQHSVEALTKVQLCVFEKDRIHELYRTHPGLAYDVTWLAACEERMLDEHLLSLGRRSAFERAAYLLAFLHVRASKSAAFGRQKLIPVTQQHVADTLGLSIVHTNKTLRKLSDRKLISWVDGGCEVLDMEGLRTIAGWEEQEDEKRPFI
jgi:CRP/FNR family transcriptional regulator, anaerobic regulatory protein